MANPRPHPFDLVFSDTAFVFEGIRDAIEQAGQDPGDRDRFLMLREVVQLLRELRPDEGLGEGIVQLAALVHHCYLYWEAGCGTVECEANQLTALLSKRQADDFPAFPPYYTRFPERRMWGQPIPGGPHEPLDGCFVYSWPDRDSLRVLGVFGIHRDRAGFSVVEVAGGRRDSLHREDGSDLFSATLPGGAAAGLFAIAGEEELLELGWRTRTLAAETAVEAGRWRA
jgi:hypothetical protein